MDGKKPPQYIMDLMNGYCKQNYKASIPICLKKIFGFYFFLKKKEILFRIKFKSPAKFTVGVANNGELISRKYFQAISSISSYFIISNKCYKLILKVGNDFVININIGESEINIKTPTEVMLLRNIDGDIWKINRKSMEFVDIMVRINRQTICECPNGDGSVELFFTNIKQIPEMDSLDSLHLLLKKNAKDEDNFYITHPRRYGGIIVKDTDGYGLILLNDDFDFDSNQNVSIEAHGTDEMYVWSSKHANHAWDQFGYGRNCCVSATFQYSGYERRLKKQI